MSISMPSLPSAAQLLQDKEGLSVQFEVVIAGLAKLIFRSCEGLDSEVDVVTYSEGGNLGCGRTARGAQRAGKITFGKGMAASGGGSANAIFKWYLDVCDSSKPLQKKMIQIASVGTSKSLAKFKLVNAWPCRWVGPLLSQDVSEFTMEHVTFAHEGIVQEI